MKLFVNLPIKDLGKTRAFFGELGFTFDENFSDERGVCMQINPDTYYMLLTEPFFQSFTDKKIADSKSTVECYNALSAESRADVDRLVDKAMDLGATLGQKPEEYDFMYSRSFRDLDGHEWSFCWMDPSFTG